MVCGDDLKYIITDLLIVHSGVHIGALYRTGGLINESKRVFSALKESLDRITVRFIPKMLSSPSISDWNEHSLIHPTFVKLYPEKNMSQLSQ